MRNACFALLILLAAGCGGDDAEKQPILSTGIENIPTPFQGTIRAKHWLHFPLNTAEVTYHIRQDQIHREIVWTNIFEKVEAARKSGAATAGVICKPAEDEVILYCSRFENKKFCQLTLAEYRALCEGKSPSSQDLHYGFGQLYLDVPEAHAATSLEEQVEIDGLKCDQYVLNFTRGDILITIETDHCPRIQVPRELLLLAEPNLPEAITGFPLRVRRTETIRQLQDVQIPADERYQELLEKAAKFASDSLEQAFESGLEILEIDTSVPEVFAFEVPSEYTKVNSVEAFENAFYIEPSGDDWD